MSKPFAAFDIDGTIFRWQLYHELFDELYRQAVISPAQAQPVFEVRDAWRRREVTFDTYELALVEVMESAIVGLPESLINQAADRILETNGHHVYRYTSELVQSLKAQGYLIVAISGSHQQLIERFARLHGIDITYGRRHEIIDGTITENVLPVYGRKAEILRELVEHHDLSWKGSYAVGDTNSDADMMELVDHPIAFNPDRKLYERAREHGWKIVLERKNMIYELEPHGNTFILA